MKTFIECPFPGNYLFDVKNNIPKKHECPLPSFFPTYPQEKLKFSMEKTRNATTYTAHVLKFMLKYLPEQVPMPLPRLKKKAC